MAIYQRIHMYERIASMSLIKVMMLCCRSSVVADFSLIRKACDRYNFRKYKMNVQLLSFVDTDMTQIT